MRFHTHLWTSALAGMLLYRARPRRALALTLAGILIDVDHYLLYAHKSGDWTPWGALHYNTYRHKPGGQRDPRPRYGSLRSVLHHPLLGLTLGLAALRIRRLRPLALGVALHLALDWWHLPLHWLRFRRAGWRCELCDSSHKLRLHLIVHRFEGGRDEPGNVAVLCARCARAAESSYPRYPPPTAAGPTQAVP
jgi:hypothetical protein